MLAHEYYFKQTQVQMMYETIQPPITMQAVIRDYVSVVGVIYPGEGGD